MKNIHTLIFLILSCTQLCFGSFSKFVDITPATQQEHDINVSVTYESNNLYVINFTWESSLKQCWLITFKPNEVPKTQRNFRNFIWDETANKQSIEEIKKLSGNQDGFIKIQIPEATVNRSFIIIDFPYAVFDGGFFYTIDLPEFLKEIKK